MIFKVISGGQTGVDISGLRAAKSLGIETGGWMPRQYMTHDGSHPEYATEYGVKVFGSYKDRTWMNVKASDITIRIAKDWNSSGENCTLNALKHYGKTYWDVEVANNGDDGQLMFVNCVKNSIDVVSTLIVAAKPYQKITTVNIAGNSEKTCPGIEEISLVFLTELFKKVLQWDSK
jgi:hypothetical protein